MPLPGAHPLNSESLCQRGTGETRGACGWVCAGRQRAAGACSRISLDLNLAAPAREPSATRTDGASRVERFRHGRTRRFSWRRRPRLRRCGALMHDARLYTLAAGSAVVGGAIAVASAILYARFTRGFVEPLSPSSPGRREQERRDSLNQFALSLMAAAGRPGARWARTARTPAGSSRSC